jgi:hypothetical protein
MRTFATTLVLALVAANTFAHYASDAEYAVSNAIALPFQVERTGPPRVVAVAPTAPVSGAGFWKFSAATDLVPLPNLTYSQITNAHGTIIVDAAADKVYWGLQGVGWIGFSNQLRNSWLIAGNSAFTNGNLHGGDIRPRGGRQSPLIAVADNRSFKVYLTDTAFQNVETLTVPTFGTYLTNNTFKPTDVAFGRGSELWIADGYGRQKFMPADFSPLKWRGDIHGGGRFSMTLHGVTYDQAHDDLLFSARPEGQLKRLNRATLRAQAIAGLPAGTKLCDVDLWGDYALAACLDGANGTAGPLYIINLKTSTIAATIKPKDDLGYTAALHLHDAAWYVRQTPQGREVYVLFTYWNPGGFGALRLVSQPD